MNNVKKGLTVAILSVLALSGCESMKERNMLTGEVEFNDTTKWATIGATGGAAVGGLGGIAGAAIGGLAGAAAGGYYGYTIDLAKEELSDAFVDFGITVEDIDGVIHISIQEAMLFNTGEYKIDEKNMHIINTFLDIVSNIEEEFFIKVSGHTDNTGELKYNISLSESRAKEIAYHLYKNGLPAKAIDYRGFADMKPVADNDTEEGRAANRRVEIEIIPGIVKY